MVEDAFPNADALRCDLQKLVVPKELKRFLKREPTGRDQAQGIIRTGGAGIGELFAFADIDGNILVLGRHADHLSGVDRLTRPEEQGTAFLSVIKAIGDRLAGLKRDQRSVVPAGNLPFVGCIAVEEGVHNPFPLGIGKKFAFVTEQPPLRKDRKSVV